MEIKEFNWSLISINNMPIILCKTKLESRKSHLTADQLTSDENCSVVNSLSAILTQFHLRVTSTMSFHKKRFSAAIYGVKISTFMGKLNAKVNFTCNGGIY